MCTDDGPIVRQSTGACVKSELPVVRVASGQRIQALGCVDFKLKLNKNFQTEQVRFFVFPDLPVQAIIGHGTNSRWKANLSWKTHSWEVTPNISSETTVSVP